MLVARQELCILCGQGGPAPLLDYLYEVILGKFVTQSLHVACVEYTCSLRLIITQYDD
jgi:hypothetical protein